MLCVGVFFSVLSLNSSLFSKKEIARIQNRAGTLWHALWYKQSMGKIFLEDV